MQIFNKRKEKLFFVIAMEKSEYLCKHFQEITPIIKTKGKLFLIIIVDFYCFISIAIIIYTK